MPNPSIIRQGEGIGAGAEIAELHSTDSTGGGTHRYANRSSVLVAGVFSIPLPAVTDCHARSQCHKGNRREQQDQHSAANGILAFLACAFGGGVTHDATLAERRDSPERQQYRQSREAQLHFTPKCRIRNASGRNTNIIAKQNTKELMVTHFMGETSNFMCMK